MIILALIILLFLGFISIGHLISKQDSLEGPADVAILFGSLDWWRLKPRIKKTTELYDKGLLKKIIISGGLNRKRKIVEAPIIKKELIKQGVKPKDLLIENKSTNFKENALFSYPIVKKIKAKSVVLIASSFEQLRCYLTTKKAFDDSKIKLINQPATTEPLWGRYNWFLKISGWDLTWQTISKLIKYRLKGDL